MNMLLDEIQQAVFWSRPSILIAVHKSKNDQIRAIVAMESKLAKNSMKVVTIVPEREAIDILGNMVSELDAQGTICFVHGLGSQTQTYAGLNMHRESVVENQVKVIFWITMDEMVLLARHAPDFWAFRHRVIEFPTGRSSRKDNLPSGTLLWHHKKQILNLNILREKIAYQQELLRNFSFQHEKTINYLQVVGDLAYYLWLAGKNKEVAELLHQEIKQIEWDGLADSISMLLNVLAVNSFDQGHFPDALDWINQALELNSNQSILWSNHGVICRYAGQGRKSLASLKKAIKLNPSSYEGWGVLGYMYMSLGKYSTALQNFDKALALCSDCVQFYPALAVCYVQTGNIDELEKIMRQLSHLAKDEDYFPICYGGLSGDMTDALARLKELILDEKIPQVFARRDPNLHFIFGPSVLQELL